MENGLPLALVVSCYLEITMLSQLITHQLLIDYHWSSISYVWLVCENFFLTSILTIGNVSCHLFINSIVFIAA